MFITLEGGEGAGKSTQLKVLGDWFARRGHEVVVTREPGGTPLAEAIRALVTSVDQRNVPAMAELYLMFAARVSHVEEVILPALAEGKTVLCDRFVDASYAYQGAGRGLPGEIIETLESWLPPRARPDLTILVDVPVELGLARVRRRGNSDRFEKEQAAFFHRVRDAYWARARQCPDRFITIDADNRRAEAVSADLVARLNERLGEVDIG